MAKEEHVRSILKAISWRLFGSLATVLIVYIYTGKMELAAEVGGFELIAKIGIFYVHERLWSVISWGVKLPQEEAIVPACEVQAEI